jgi:2-polyprenyl-3-methyl-5-hydroxy-6-metoxy-1,4-benzoquinol methylase
MNDSIKTKASAYYMLERADMLKFVPKNSKKILEVGCGEGNFGALLKSKLEAEVWGIEYEPNRAEQASHRIDKIFCGDVTALIDDLPDSYFDAIIFNDVLEHLTDPYAILERIKPKFSSNGVVISSIPNIRYFRNFFDLIFRKNWDYAENGIMDFTHFRFFTVNSIRKMYENLNYEVITLKGISITKSLKPWPWIIFSFGFFSDIRFLQFATVARPKK